MFRKLQKKKQEIMFKNTFERELIILFKTKHSSVNLVYQFSLKFNTCDVYS